jgi:GT2 family glycosyltransferase
LTAVSRPSVTIVFLAFNRREELRASLREMLSASDYGGEVDVIVVDNASTDGSADMVRGEFPEVRVMSHDRNVGVSGWNIGLAAARGDYVLALDDDAYLPSDGLRQAVEAAEAHDADLVSFKVVSTRNPAFVFTEDYPTGLCSFWGCAVLMRREVIDELGGYDPEIFIWANELEFMMRFFDRGLRHLHLPEVAARHMKSLQGGKALGWKPYRIHAGRFAYIAAKRLRRREALGALMAVIAQKIRDGVRMHPWAVSAVPIVLREFVRGLRHRQPVANPELSRFYRHNFVSFASPWWLSRTPLELLRRGPVRWQEYFRRRARFYPDRASTLDFK